MSALTLYNYDLDENCYKVRLLLSCLGVEADQVAVDVMPGKENLSPAILAMSPFGALPVVRQDDLVLYEAEAILASIEMALAGDWSKTVNPYGDGHAAQRIVSHLASIACPSMLIRKSFMDVTHG